MISNLHIERLFTILNEEQYIYLNGWSLNKTFNQFEFTLPDFGIELSLDNVVFYEREDLDEYFLKQSIQLQSQPKAFIAKYLIKNNNILISDFEKLNILSLTDSLFFPDTEVISLTLKMLPANEIIFDKIRSLMKNNPVETYIMNGIYSKKFETNDSKIIVEQFALFDGKLCIIGWYPDLATQKFYIFNTKTLKLTSLVYFVSVRHDVTQHLSANNHIPKSNIHGFIGFTNACFTNLENLILIAEGENNFSIIHLDIISGKNYNTIGNNLAIELVKRICIESPHQLNNFFRNHVVKTNLEDKINLSRSIEFKTFETKPVLSVIVPFYATDFFLLDIIEMQQRSPVDFQWIIVCDDMSLFTPMYNYLINNSVKLVRSFKLIKTTGDSGFATANNIGASYADGDKILFMNSDIYVRDFIAINYAINLLIPESKNIIGFTLLFEDNSIQHDGIEFVESSKYGGLVLAEHRQKGLPKFVNTQLISHKTVVAVSGALMLLNKEANKNFEYFDSCYRNGDFEDVDLCLKHKQNGGDSILVQTDDIYHLERQSIGTIDQNKRQLNTLRNSNLFSQRWKTNLIQQGYLI